MAGEAGAAVVALGEAERLEQALDAQVAERVGADVLADAVDRHPGGDQLAPAGDVDPEVAGVDERRAVDADVDFARAAALAQQADELTGGRAADDRVVDDDDPLTAEDLGQGVVLQVDAGLAHALLGLNERSVYVAALDQPLAVRQPAGLGV